LGGEKRARLRASLDRLDIAIQDPYPDLVHGRQLLPFLAPVRFLIAFIDLWGVGCEGRA
jgi:hypothetical protein